MNFFTPAEVAKNYIATGKSKVNTPIPKMIILAILAGAFIGFGGVGATTVAVSITEPSLGKFIGACVFPGGLTMDRWSAGRRRRCIQSPAVSV